MVVCFLLFFFPLFFGQHYNIIAGTVRACVCVCVHARRCVTIIITLVTGSCGSRCIHNEPVRAMSVIADARSVYSLGTLL